jgi:hypothetical protein
LANTRSPTIRRHTLARQTTAIGRYGRIAFLRFLDPPARRQAPLGVRWASVKRRQTPLGVRWASAGRPLGVRQAPLGVRKTALAVVLRIILPLDAFLT